ncbi:hypothetical protein LINPERHAP2_LOCUS4598 [Linum perenne]
MAKLQFGHPNSIVNTKWPRKLRKPYFRPTQVPESFVRSPDSVFVVLQEIPEQETDHWSFLRRAGAVDHETVY